LRKVAEEPVSVKLAHFLQIAMGSASELEYNLLLAHELGFVDGALYQQLQVRTIEVKRRLTGFIPES
jgi:four helix bundle protein